MKKKPTKRVGKIRQNISLDIDVRDLLRKSATAKRTTVSGLITRWVLESGDFAELRLLDDPECDEGRKAK